MENLMIRKPKFLFAISPSKFKVKYKKRSGEIKNYLTVPIEVLPDRFIGYVFGSGIRSFRNSGILKIEQFNEKQN